MARNPALAMSGVTAAVVSLASLLLATMLSPSFAWTANALSNLGVPGTEAGTRTTAFLFNWGLVAGALLGLVFAYYLWTQVETRGKRVVSVLLAATLLSMGAIGVFPQGTALHVPVAVAFFVLVTVTIWADAVVVGGTEEGLRGAVATWLGAANVGAWVVWAATGPIRRPGLALPEIVGALVFAIWIVSTAIRLSRWDSAVDSSPAH
ncbi:MAG: DUF998 domain-containing protein [Haloarculaceae archaeon]